MKTPGTRCPCLCCCVDDEDENERTTSRSGVCLLRKTAFIDKETCIKDLRIDGEHEVIQELLLLYLTVTIGRKLAKREGNYLIRN